MKSATTLSLQPTGGRAPSPGAAGSIAAWRLVLDTNAVLDLWAFCDPRVAPLRRDLEDARVEWTATAAMRQELQAVLERGVASRHGAKTDAVLAHWDRHARVVEPPAATPTHRLRCRDGDDQQFIDLALHARAQWLLTSDRDLLTLARPAAASGLQIRSPHGWCAAGADAFRSGGGPIQSGMHPIQHVVPGA